MPNERCDVDDGGRRGPDASDWHVRAAIERADSARCVARSSTIEKFDRESLRVLASKPGEEQRKAALVLCRNTLRKIESEAKTDGFGRVDVVKYNATVLQHVYRILAFFCDINKEYTSSLRYTDLHEVWTDSIATYVQLEMRLSRTSSLDVPNVARRILTRMHVALKADRSDTTGAVSVLAKVFYPPKNVRDVALYFTVYEKVLRERRVEPCDLVGYTLTALAFRRWFNMTNVLGRNDDVRDQIEKLSMQILHLYDRTLPNLDASLVTPKYAYMFNVARYKKGIDMKNHLMVNKYHVSNAYANFIAYAEDVSRNEFVKTLSNRSCDLVFPTPIKIESDDDDCVIVDSDSSSNNSVSVRLSERIRDVDLGPVKASRSPEPHVTIDLDSDDDVVVVEDVDVKPDVGLRPEIDVKPPLFRKARRRQRTERRRPEYQSGASAARLEIKEEDDDAVKQEVGQDRPEVLWTGRSKIRWSVDANGNESTTTRPPSDGVEEQVDVPATPRDDENADDGVVERVLPEEPTDETEDVREEAKQVDEEVLEDELSHVSDEELRETCDVGKSIVDESIAYKSIVDEPIVDEPIVDEPIVVKSIVNKPIMDESIVDESMVYETIVDEPIVVKSILNKPIVVERIVDELIMDEPIAVKSIVNKPIMDESIVDEPIVVKSIVNKPIMDESNVDESMVDETFVDKPIVVKSILNKPIVDEPIVDEPIVDEQIVEEPIVDEPIVEEPIVDEPIVEEPIVEEPIVEEPIVDEQIVDEPIVDELIVDESIVDEPTVEEPTVDEPTVDEPIVHRSIVNESVVNESKEQSARRTTEETSPQQDTNSEESARQRDVAEVKKTTDDLRLKEMIESLTAEFEETERLLSDRGTVLDGDLRARPEDEPLDPGLEDRIIEDPDSECCQAERGRSPSPESVRADRENETGTETPEQARLRDTTSRRRSKSVSVEPEIRGRRAARSFSIEKDRLSVDEGRSVIERHVMAPLIDAGFFGGLSEADSIPVEVCSNEDLRRDDREAIESEIPEPESGTTESPDGKQDDSLDAVPSEVITRSGETEERRDEPGEVCESVDSRPERGDCSEIDEQDLSKDKVEEKTPSLDDACRFSVVENSQVVVPVEETVEIEPTGDCMSNDVGETTVEQFAVEENSVESDDENALVIDVSEGEEQDKVDDRSEASIEDRSDVSTDENRDEISLREKPEGEKGEEKGKEEEEVDLCVSVSAGDPSRADEVATPDEDPLSVKESELESSIGADNDTRSEVVEAAKDDPDLGIGLDAHEALSESAPSPDSTISPIELNQYSPLSAVDRNEYESHIDEYRFVGPDVGKTAAPKPDRPAPRPLETIQELLYESSPTESGYMSEMECPEAVDPAGGTVDAPDLKAGRKYAGFEVRPRSVAEPKKEPSADDVCGEIVAEIVDRAIEALETKIDDIQAAEDTNTAVVEEAVATKTAAVRRKRIRNSIGRRRKRRKQRPRSKRVEAATVERAQDVPKIVAEPTEKILTEIERLTELCRIAIDKHNLSFVSVSDEGVVAAAEDVGAVEVDPLDVKQSEEIADKPDPPVPEALLILSEASVVAELKPADVETKLLNHNLEKFAEIAIQDALSAGYVDESAPTPPKQQHDDADARSKAHESKEDARKHLENLIDRIKRSRKNSFMIDDILDAPKAKRSKQDDDASSTTTTSPSRFTTAASKKYYESEPETETATTAEPVDVESQEAARIAAAPSPVLPRPNPKHVIMVMKKEYEPVSDPEDDKKIDSEVSTGETPFETERRITRSSYRPKASVAVDVWQCVEPKRRTGGRKKQPRAKKKKPASSSSTYDPSVDDLKIINGDPEIDPEDVPIASFKWATFKKKDVDPATTTTTVPERSSSDVDEEDRPLFERLVCRNVKKSKTQSVVRPVARKRITGAAPPKKRSKCVESIDQREKSEKREAVKADPPPAVDVYDFDVELRNEEPIIMNFNAGRKYGRSVPKLQPFKPTVEPKRKQKPVDKTKRMRGARKTVKKEPEQRIRAAPVKDVKKVSFVDDVEKNDDGAEEESDKKDGAVVENDKKQSVDAEDTTTTKTEQEQDGRENASRRKRVPCRELRTQSADAPSTSTTGAKPSGTETDPEEYGVAGYKIGKFKKLCKHRDAGPTTRTTTSESETETDGTRGAYKIDKFKKMCRDRRSADEEAPPPTESPTTGSEPATTTTEPATTPEPATTSEPPTCPPSQIDPVIPPTVSTSPVTDVVDVPPKRGDDDDAVPSSLACAKLVEELCDNLQVVDAPVAVELPVEPTVEPAPKRRDEEDDAAAKRATAVSPAEAEIMTSLKNVEMIVSRIVEDSMDATTTPTADDDVDDVVDSSVEMLVAGLQIDMLQACKNDIEKTIAVADEKASTTTSPTTTPSSPPSDRTNGFIPTTVAELSEPPSATSVDVSAPSTTTASSTSTSTVSQDECTSGADSEVGSSDASSPSPVDKAAKRRRRQSTLLDDDVDAPKLPNAAACLPPVEFDIFDDFMKTSFEDSDIALVISDIVLPPLFPTDDALSSSSSTSSNGQGAGGVRCGAGDAAASHWKHQQYNDSKHDPLLGSTSTSNYKDFENLDEPGLCSIVGYGSEPNGIIDMEINTATGVLWMTAAVATPEKQKPKECADVDKDIVVEDFGRSETIVTLPTPTTTPTEPADDGQVSVNETTTTPPRPRPPPPVEERHFVPADEARTPEPNRPTAHHRPAFDKKSSQVRTTVRLPPPPPLLKRSPQPPHPAPSTTTTTPREYHRPASKDAPRREIAVGCRMPTTRPPVPTTFRPFAKRPEPRFEPRLESRGEPRQELRIESREEPRPEPRLESRPESRPEPRLEPRLELRFESRPRQDSRPKPLSMPILVEEPRMSTRTGKSPLGMPILVDESDTPTRRRSPEYTKYRPWVSDSRPKQPPPATKGFYRPYEYARPPRSTLDAAYKPDADKTEPKMYARSRRRIYDDVDVAPPPSLSVLEWASTTLPTHRRDERPHEKPRGVRPTARPDSDPGADERSRLPLAYRRSNDDWERRHAEERAKRKQRCSNEPHYVGAPPTRTAPSNDDDWRRRVPVTSHEHLFPPAQKKTRIN